jgi:hypothetical protein
MPSTRTFLRTFPTTLQVRVRQNEVLEIQVRQMSNVDEEKIIIFCTNKQ